MKEHFLLKTTRLKSMSTMYQNSLSGTGSAMRMMWFCREHDIDICAIESYHKRRSIPDYFKRLMSPTNKDPPPPPTPDTNL